MAVLVHQSPRSSAEYAALIERLADRYTLIAPDNCGNGLSDALPQSARTIEDYGDALAEFLTAIGVDRVLLYGFHTGGAIGLAFASRHPHRVAAAVLNGIPVPDAQHVEAHVAHYLPPFAPQWDGGHLAWTWARLREQTFFYPWFSKAEADRVAFVPPDGDALFDACLELFRAGDAYRHSYEAAFRIQTQELVSALNCYAVIASSRWDPLYDEMERLHVPASLERVRLGTDRGESVSLIERCFAAYAGGADQQLPSLPLSDRGFSNDVFYRRRTGIGRELVLIHDHHDDSSGSEIAAAELAEPRPTIAIDLPGHGESTADWHTKIADTAAVVQETLISLGLRNAQICGFGLGARVADEVIALGGFARHGDHQAPRLTRRSHTMGTRLIDDMLATREHAGRLFGAWRMARDGALFDPWCDPTPAAARRPAGDLDPVAVHRRALAALKSMRSWQASWSSMVPEG